MSVEILLQQLGYEGSPCFLRRGDNRFETELGYGHIFRQAKDPTNPRSPRWQAEGVYGIRESADGSGRFIPLVYVCTAHDGHAARDLHRLLWNQNVAPYIIVHSVDGIRVYSGFCYDQQAKSAQGQGIVQALTEFNQAQEIIALFHHEFIDDGRLWQHPALRVDPSKRVHHKLLATLRQLDKDLQKDGLNKDVSHALIGKYVYLRYLRDRGILSDERLGKWGIDAKNIFSSKAQKNSLTTLCDALDDWLNGEIFPLPWRGTKSPSVDHIRSVAGAFSGEERTTAGVQQHLDFQAYDFSFIPIETLSLVYEQFLHIDSDDTGDSKTKKKTEGRQEGAYYTPLPLVNFMLAELERVRPLQRGMKIFDPSCGSGTFLVQAYRLLIEKTFPATKNPPKPSELRKLLEESIFGCDVDADACQVTQLSLLLTLLDYVKPRDLSGPMHSFQLPTLCETTNEEKLQAGHTPNILHRNFFGIEAVLAEAVVGKQGATANWGLQGFDWIVGNPPWKTIRPKDLGRNDQAVWDWMRERHAEMPVGLNQAAQAFAWETSRYLKTDGECALLLPAMGLFEEPSEVFRRAFFNAFAVHTVANFTNLAEVLFEGRARVPAASVCYRLRAAGDENARHDEAISVYSPFVVNQESTCPQSEGERGKIWSLSLNYSEVRALTTSDARSGSGLPWKIAMWGSPWDQRLLERMEKKWPSLGQLEARWHSTEKRFVHDDEQRIFGLSEGLQLRTAPENAKDPLIPFDWSLKWKVLKIDQLDRLRHVFAVPTSATPELEKRSWYGRGGRATLPLTVCSPPHVIVSETRYFAVYSEEHLIVPPRQIGIISSNGDADMLKALSLFLSSDFAFYHQFFRSTHLGVKRDVATLASLRLMPIPLVSMSRDGLREWVKLHAQLVKQAPRTLEDVRRKDEQRQGNLFEARDFKLDDLLRQLNGLTAEVLGLTTEEIALVHDLVHVRYALTDGKRGNAAMRPPSIDELHAYATALKNELDEFVGDDSPRQHGIAIVADGKSVMVEIDFTRDRKAAGAIAVMDASRSDERQLRETRDRLLDENRARQWTYFNRNLRIYQGRKTYVLKPANLFHWTVSAALGDATEIIAETLGGQ